MKKIDTVKLSKEMSDTLIHRACVMRSGEYLSKYLVHKDRSVDAIRLIGRCSVHDISKIQNTEEFMSLASIVEEIDAMRDVEHRLSEKQANAIRLHWSNNSHHPEFYDSPNDMSELDLLEMACDCHARSKQYGTDLLDYIDNQQEIRFHFDKEHFRRLRTYAVVLAELTKNDDYSAVIGDTSKICFDLKNSTMELLEEFDESCYVDCIRTDRLYLKKEQNHDFASVVYSINLRDDNTQVGYISLKCNGYIEFKIYENYKENGYALEALREIMEISNMPELCVYVKKDNDLAMAIMEELGFKALEVYENNLVYRYKKPKFALTYPVPVIG